MIFGDLITRNARRYPDIDGIIFEDKRFTWKQANERVNQCVRSLRRMGVSKGDRVAILSGNCHQYWECYCAGGKSGIILVPLNYRLVGRELIYILNNSEANTIIMGPDYVNTVLSIKSDLKHIRNMIIFAEPQGNIWGYEELLKKESTEEPDCSVNESDLFWIMYTSGTTGLPKGVMINHKNVLTDALDDMLAYRMKKDDALLVTPPLYHAAGTAISYSAMYVGAKIIFMTKWDAEKTRELIEREKVTASWWNSAMLTDLLKSPSLQRRDHRTLRSIMYAGSPMPVELLKRAFPVFGKIFWGLYGLTENTSSATHLPIEEHFTEGPEHKVARLYSVGKELISIHVRVVNELMKDVKPGEVGEIVIKGDTVMQGYWNNPEATKEAIRDGWLLTGDLARVDEEGYIYIIDRKKDMIISGGENIYSKEVEDVINSHPSVLESAVIGVEDPKWIESVMAIVVLLPNKKLTGEELIDFCKKNLASYKKPRYVEFMDSLPRNPSGKVLKGALRKKYRKSKIIPG
jgi:acyl-CoA synthetase (AMP-forming)/AMP-acid ligase II